MITESGPRMTLSLVVSKTEVFVFFFFSNDGGLIAAKSFESKL